MLNIPESRIGFCQDKDNFWSMGDTGPCGYCTEIFYDHGSDYSGNQPGYGDEGDRYVEIWNLVFMAFDKSQDGTLKPLPKPSVDTGMGLERIAAVMQGVSDNYDIDLFKNLIDEINIYLPDCDDKNLAARVIADHLRSSAFLLLDGVIPSNEKQGYVLRRIIRRAVLKAYQCGFEQPILVKVLPVLVRLMQSAYPELKERQSFITKQLLKEEVNCLNLITNGISRLEHSIDFTTSQLTGEVAFALYDTYGVPKDLMLDYCSLNNIAFDDDLFVKLLDDQRKRSKLHDNFANLEEVKVQYSTEFLGYVFDTCESIIKELFIDNVSVSHASSGSNAVIVLDKSFFMQKVVARLVMLVFCLQITVKLVLLTQKNRIRFCSCLSHYIWRSESRGCGAGCVYTTEEIR